MNIQRYITLTVFSLFCLPLVALSAPSQYADLTYGFLGKPLPEDVALYKGIIDNIPEKGKIVSINDTLYQLMPGTVYLTPYKSRTSLEYFQPATSVKFYAHIHNKVIYEIMATSEPAQPGTTQKQSSKETGGLILEDGVWHN